MLEAVFNEYTELVTLSGLWQWDYGQKLYIKGLNLPENTEVHFSNCKESEAIKMISSNENDYTVVEVPNVLLEKSLDIEAWIYEVGENSGETLKSIVLKVRKRAKPQDFTSTNNVVENLEAFIRKIVQEELA